MQGMERRATEAATDARRIGRTLTVIALVLATAATLADAASARARHRRSASHWVGTWATSPDVAGAGYANQTLREIVTPTLSGPVVRIRLSNALGTQTVSFKFVKIGLSRGGATAAGLRPVRFGRRLSVRIPAGATRWSDPVSLRVRAFSPVVVNLYSPGATGPATTQPQSMQTAYVGTGDQTGDAGSRDFSSSTQTWSFLAGIAVRAPKRARSVVAFGDSITSGSHSTVDAGHRYPDYLAARLQATACTRNLSVLNAGLTSNRLVAPGGTGPTGLDRFAADALGQPGVGAVIVLEGINDVAAGASATQITTALQQLVARAHARHVKVLLGTLTPAGDPAAPHDATFSSPAAVQTRDAVNAWIRQSHVADGIVDFDAAVHSSGDGDELAPQLDSGDHLHPNDAGYQAMAQAVPLGPLRRLAGCGP